MTDKQIIIEDCPHFIGGCCQEYLDGVCANHKCDLKIIIELKQKLKAKEQECEGLKEEIKKHNDDMFKNPPEKRFYCKGCTLPYISKKQSQTLTEIKEVLQFYNNTTIGVDKGNGVFELEVFNDNVGKLIYCYDTNPAKEALQKISECEGNDE